MNVDDAKSIIKVLIKDCHMDHAKQLAIKAYECDSSWYGSMHPDTAEIKENEWRDLFEDYGWNFPE